MNKIKIQLLTLTLLAFLMQGHSQEMSFEEYNPKSTLVVPENIVEKARFPFIDIHSHHFQMATQDLSELISSMDNMNMAVMVNLSGGSGEGLKNMMDNINRNYPNRFVVFANVNFEGVGNPDWADNAVRQLEQDVKNGAKGLKIYK